MRAVEEGRISNGRSGSAGGVAAFLAVWLGGALGWATSYPGLPALDALYKAVQLFGLNFDTPDLAGSPNTLLHAARFLAPALAVAAVVAALSSRFSAGLRSRWRAARAQGQAVVIGYGETGRAAARALRRARPTARIVAVDRQVDEASHKAARSDGVEIYAADALSPAMHKMPIALPRSDTVIVAAGDDGASLAIAESLGAQADLWLSVRNRRLREQLRDAPGAAHPFGLDEAMVQAALLRHPPALEARAFGLKRVHAVIHGWSDLGWAMAEQILLTGHMPGPGFSSPIVSVIATDAAAARAAWDRRHPSLTEIDIAFFQEAGQVGEGTPLAEIEALAPPSLHVVTLGEDALSLSAALALQEAMRRGIRRPAPILVHAEMRGAAAVEPAQPSAILQHRIHVIGDPDEAAGFTPFGNAVLERFARFIHEDYLTLAPGPAFDALPETLRVSNRRAAYHFLHKLKLFGFEDAAPTDAAFGIGVDGVRAVEAMDEGTARMFDVLEHLRWRADRLLEGWRQGERDDERRLRDQLRLGWTAADSLSVVEKRKDRSQFAAFTALNLGTPEPAHVPRIVDYAYAGPPPAWHIGTEGFSLALDIAPHWPALLPTLAAGETCRVRMLLPREPGLAETGCRDHNQRLARLRAALADFAETVLASLPQRTTLRLERLPAPGYDWLASAPRLDGVVLPPPVFGLAMPEAQADEAMAFVDQIGGPGTTILIDPALAERCRAAGHQVCVVQPADAAPRLSETPAEALERTLLDQASILVATAENKSLVEAARARHMTLRVL